MPAHIIDANVIIHGSSMDLDFESMMTVPGVTAELDSTEARRRFDTMDVDIREPSDDDREEVDAVVDRTGVDVSGTDRDLVALALGQDGVLVTDDYAMQTLAAELDIACEGFLKDGIDDSITWKTVCENCGRDVDGERCPVCGTGVRKVPDRG
jgi:rRNA maturation endonuclease Nob1